MPAVRTGTTAPLASWHEPAAKPGKGGGEKYGMSAKSRIEWTPEMDAALIDV